MKISRSPNCFSETPLGLGRQLGRLLLGERHGLRRCLGPRTGHAVEVRHPHEEVGEAQQVVLLPDVVRMAMALGTLQPQAEERMRHLDGVIDAGGHAPLPVEVERLPRGVGLRAVCLRLLPSGPPTASSAHSSQLRPSRLVASQDALDELVVGDVLLQAGPQPFVDRDLILDRRAESRPA